MPSDESASTAKPASTAADAEQARLLADDRQDEVVVRLGQEEELLLARAEADAEQPAGAERELRLHELVAVPERIGPRVEEREQARTRYERMSSAPASAGRASERREQQVIESRAARRRPARR